MTSTVQHYEDHLGPVYLWMAGGLDAALSRGAGEIQAVLSDLPDEATVVDLGAGFGMHAIPLARRGCAVIAIDSSPRMLADLRSCAQGLPVTAVEGDLLSFQAHLASGAHAIVCMGDTLTHLPDLEDVEQLASSVANSLLPGGKFVTTFRDYTTPLRGEARFIPVRSDRDRILTCFLEYGDTHVRVHDLLHERVGSDWKLRVSSYLKLRLSPQWVCTALRAAGLAVRVEAGPSGMVRVVARR